MVEWVCVVDGALVLFDSNPPGSSRPPAVRAVATRSRPARRDMRSARSASNAVVEDKEFEDE